MMLKGNYETVDRNFIFGKMYIRFHNLSITGIKFIISTASGSYKVNFVRLYKLVYIFI